MTEPTQPTTAADTALRQAIYDGLPEGADDELYEIADGVFASVSRYLARQQDASALRAALEYAREQLAMTLAAIRDVDRNFRDDAYCRECGKGPSVLQHDDPDCGLSPLQMADVSMRAARGAIGEVLAVLPPSTPPALDSERDVNRLQHAWMILTAQTNPERWEPDRYNCAAFLEAWLAEYARLDPER